MAIDSALKADCERMYVDELLSIEEVCSKTGVSPTTFYRWRKEGGWDQERENTMGLREKLGRLLYRLIEAQLEPGAQIDTQGVFSLIKILEKYQRTGAVRERIIYVEDAERLFEIMKSMDQFKTLLEDQEVLAQLGERLKEKSRS